MIYNGVRSSARTYQGGGWRAYHGVDCSRGETVLQYHGRQERDLKEEQEEQEEQEGV